MTTTIREAWGTTRCPQEHAELDTVTQHLTPVALCLIATDQEPVVDVAQIGAVSGPGWFQTQLLSERVIHPPASQTGEAFSWWRQSVTQRSLACLFQQLHKLFLEVCNRPKNAVTSKALAIAIYNKPLVEHSELAAVGNLAIWVCQMWNTVLILIEEKTFPTIVK